MVFNSIDFLFFFAIVYSVYWILSHRIQNLFLLAASLFFYGFWDWRFLSLLLLSSIVDYFAGIGIEKNSDQKKLYLTLSVATNLGILGFFKYYNFFLESALQFLGFLELKPEIHTLEIILPLGISFYTFQTMSYTIDVYRGQLKPIENFLDFALYVSFFPQLVAGPIERATRLLPQIQSQRSWNLRQVQEGGFLVLLGYFKKVYVADNLGEIVNSVYTQEDPSGSTIFGGMIAFVFQIYCDFSGYSDIARGIAKWMGFELMQNFRNPLLAVNILDLWKRWHISLMSWFRDYVYIPLGGNRVSEMRQHLNNLLIFFISGLWHGANWTFVIWGIYNGILTSLYRWTSPVFQLRKSQTTINPFWGSVGHSASILSTFFLFSYSGIWFRAKDINQAWEFTRKLFTDFYDLEGDMLYKIFRLTFLLIIIEISQYRKEDEFSVFRWKLPFRVALYMAMFYSVLILGNFNKNEFIYFVF